MTQAQAWRVLDILFDNPNIDLVEEPDGLDVLFRRLTDRDEISPKRWADGYLAAFATASSLTLVPFDLALSKSVRRSVLL